MEHKIKETIEFIHNDIKIYIKIDYINNRIDIVEPVNGLQSGNFKKKEFCFIGRGVEYMNGWLKILEAIQEAVKFAKKKYEQQLAETSKFKKTKMIEILKIGLNEKKNYGKRI
jgi:hypothetical protein